MTALAYGVVCTLIVAACLYANTRPAAAPQTPPQPLPPPGAAGEAITTGTPDGDR